MQSENDQDALSDTKSQARRSLPNDARKFLAPSFFLFVGQLLVALGNWVYWLVAAKLATATDIGSATTIYSIVMIIHTVGQLGLEYPLLKKASESRKTIFGTALIIELVITVPSVVTMFLISNILYEDSQEFALLGAGILALSALGFVSRFAMLGISRAKTVLLVDIFGTAAKFTSAVVLLSLGYGASGILMSFLIFAGITTSTSVILASRYFGTKNGDLKFGLDILKDGLFNMPAKLSNIFIVSLSVVLLAWHGVSAGEIGVFYIVLMVSIVAGSFASSVAYMSMPASSALHSDLSSSALRISLIVTTPVAACILVGAAPLLEVLGNQFGSGTSLLIILALGILPSVIISNVTSTLNNQKKPQSLLILGVSRLGVFLIAFITLVPIYGIAGGAIAIVASSLSAAVISAAWLSRSSLKIVGSSLISFIAGVSGGFLLSSLRSDSTVLGTIATFAIASATLILLKCVSIAEIRQVGVLSRRSSLT